MATVHPPHRQLWFILLSACFAAVYTPTGASAETIITACPTATATVVVSAAVDAVTFDSCGPWSDVVVNLTLAPRVRPFAVRLSNTTATGGSFFIFVPAAADESAAVAVRDIAVVLDRVVWSSATGPVATIEMPTGRNHRMDNVSFDVSRSRITDASRDVGSISNQHLAINGVRFVLEDSTITSATESGVNMYVMAPLQRHVVDMAVSMTSSHIHMSGPWLLVALGVAGRFTAVSLTGFHADANDSTIRVISNPVNSNTAGTVALGIGSTSNWDGQGEATLADATIRLRNVTIESKCEVRASSGSSTASVAVAAGTGVAHRYKSATALMSNVTIHATGGSDVSSHTICRGGACGCGAAAVGVAAGSASSGGASATMASGSLSASSGTRVRSTIDCPTMSYGVGGASAAMSIVARSSNAASDSTMLLGAIAMSVCGDSTVTARCPGSTNCASAAFGLLSAATSARVNVTSLWYEVVDSSLATDGGCLNLVPRNSRLVSVVSNSTLDGCPRTSTDKPVAAPAPLAWKLQRDFSLFGLTGSDKAPVIAAARGCGLATEAPSTVDDAKVPSGESVTGSGARVERAHPLYFAPQALRHTWTSVVEALPDNQRSSFPSTANVGDTSAVCFDGRFVWVRRGRRHVFRVDTRQREVHTATEAFATLPADSLHSQLVCPSSPLPPSSTDAGGDEPTTLARHVYVMPGSRLSSDLTVFRIDKTTGDVAPLDLPQPIATATAGGAGTGALDARGNFWGAPFSGRAVYNLSLAKLEATVFAEFPADLVTSSAWGSDGGIAFSAAVFDAVGRRVFFIPSDANALLEVSTEAGVMRTIKPWPSSMAPAGGCCAFSGAAWDASTGRLWLVPGSTAAVLYVDVDSEHATTAGAVAWSSTMQVADTSVGHQHFHGVINDGSRLWMLRAGEAQHLRLSLQNGTVEAAPGTSIGTAMPSFAAGVFDGESVWLVGGGNATSIHRIRGDPAYAPLRRTPSMTLPPRAPRTATSTLVPTATTIAVVPTLTVPVEGTATVVVATPPPSPAPTPAPPAPRSETEEMEPPPALKPKALTDYPPAVTAGGSAAAVVGSVASPSAAGRVPAFAYAVDVATCGGGTDDPPSRMEHPLYVSIGDGNLAPYSGAALTSCVIAAVPMAGLLLNARRAQPTEAAATSAQERSTLPGVSTPNVAYASIAAAMFHAYLAPGVAGAATSVMTADEATPLQMGVSVVAALALLASFIVMVATTRRIDAFVTIDVIKIVRPAKGDGAEKVTEESVIVSNAATPSFIAIAGPFIDGARDVNRLSSRMWFAEDVLFSCAVAVAASHEGLSCSASSYIVLTCCIAHAAFLVGSRPYDAHVDTAFAIGAGLIVAALAAIALGASHDPETIERLVYAQTFLFLLQPFVDLAIYVLRTRPSRKRLMAAMEERRQLAAAGGGGDVSHTTPLLTVPTAVGAVAEPSAAPLGPKLQLSNGSGLRKESARPVAQRRSRSHSNGTSSDGNARDIAGDCSPPNPKRESARANPLARR